ncbi:MAG: pilus assembly protein PilM [Coriobacteriales bacterium]
MAKQFIGIDIGTGHAKLAVFDGQQLVQAVLCELPDGLVRDGRITSFEAMSDVIKASLKESKISARECAIALHPTDVLMRRVTMPAMTVDQLELNLPYEFRDYIAEGKARYNFDYAVLNISEDESGKPCEMDLLAAAAEKDVIENYSAMLHRAGLRLKVAAPDVMAYVNLIARDKELHPVAEGEPPRDYCILDIGSRNTGLYLFPQGRYEMMRLIDLGISNFYNAVADALNIDPAMARTYMLSNYEDAQTLPVCMDLYERLATEIARVISFYNFNFPNSNLEAVHVCGRGTNITPLMETLNEHVPVQLIDICKLLPPSELPADLLRQCDIAAGIAL